MADLVSLTDRIEEHDGYIKFQANRWSRHEGEFDDFVQIGMIAVWQAREKLKEKPDKKHSSAFYRTRIEWAMGNEAARRRTKEPIHESLDEILKSDMEGHDLF